MKNEKILLKTLQTLSILYIEDEEHIRKDMITTLGLLCKKIYSFECAQIALQEYNTLQPDIIFSDISLGETSGLEFAKKIREIDKKIPIILLSAHTDTKYLLEATKLKLVAYLIKPITFEELKSTLLETVKEISYEDTNIVFALNENITYDTFHKVLYDRNSKEIKLSASETKLLEYFIKNKNRTISQEEIKGAVWDDPYDATDAALKSLLHKVRSKTGKETIKNLSSIGYYLNINN